MTITTEQAVALAEKPIGYIIRTGHGVHFREKLSPGLEALEHGGNKIWAPVFTRQQVIEQLAQESGVMPEAVAWFAEYGGDVYAGEEVCEAIAAMQARVKRLEKFKKLWRFALIESPEWTYAICQWSPDDNEWLPLKQSGGVEELEAAINKESGK